MSEYIEDGRAVTTLFVVFIIGLVIMYIHELRLKVDRLEEENEQLQHTADEQKKTIDTFMYYYKSFLNSPTHNSN